VLTLSSVQSSVKADDAQPKQTQAAKQMRTKNQK